jgi:multidrug resistance efflux pump
MSKISPSEILPKVTSEPGISEPTDTATKTFNPSQDLSTYSSKKKFSWQRWLKGGFFITAGAIAAMVGITTINCRVTHLIVDTGLINGRVVHLQTPIDGEIKNMFAQPGVQTSSGQVLAKISTSPQEAQSLLQLQGEVRSGEAQLAVARQSLAMLQNQFQNLNHQLGVYWSASTNRNSGFVSEQQSALEAAISRMRSAHSAYESNAQLLSAGVVSRLQVEQLYEAWKAAEAGVKQAQAGLKNAQTAQLSAVQNVPGEDVAANLMEQRTKVEQAIQTQSNLVETLKVQLESNQKRLQQAQSLFGDRHDLAMTAPFSGLIYQISHEKGEQVSRTQSLITLLDCNSLWVEAAVNATDAASINRNAPVMVQLEGYKQPIRGELDLVQPISSVQNVDEQARLMQSQALAPTIPMNLMGQPLVRLTVRIPPPPQYAHAKQFCGVGQVAQMSFQRRYPWGTHS